MKTYRVVLNNPAHGHVVVAADRSEVHDPGGCACVTFFRGDEVVAMFFGVAGITTIGPIEAAEG